MCVCVCVCVCVYVRVKRGSRAVGRASERKYGGARLGFSIQL
jgi:hypothetical protein